MDRAIRKNIVKKLVLLCSFLCFVNFNIHSGLTSQELFLRGNLLYQSDDVKGARQSYEKINQKGAVVWYNLGNCYFSDGNYVQALACWLRAQKTAPQKLYKLIKKNLDILYKKQNIFSEPTFYQKVLQQIDFFISFYSLAFWQFVFLVFWILLILLLVWMWRSRHYFFIVSLIIICVGSGLLLYRKYFLMTRVLGVVKIEKTLIFSIPDKQAHSRGVVPLARYVQVDQQNDNWYRISYNSLSGWVDASSIEIV